jgi:hypothetical protein
VIEPYKGRKIDPKRRVEAYRNIKIKKPGPQVWYSVRQDGLVVGHTNELFLKNVYFVVRESGRQRVLKTGRKNVHAWVLGYLDRGRRVAGFGPGRAGMYNPRYDSSFLILEDGVIWTPVTAAMKVRLHAKGMTIWMKRM